MKKNNRLSVWQFLVIGYALIILLGSLLLKLPFATKKGESTTFINALFTSTSASCVTGLITYDTGTHWSLFGQITILCLIQIGGIGFMTFVSFGFSLLKKNIGLYQKNILMQSSGETSLKNLKPLFKRIIIGTIVFELIGAIILSTRFIPDFGLKGIYYSIFHSISAFCNAGFDVLGKSDSQFLSLATYSKDTVVLITIAFLILLGGLGFVVWNDVYQCKFRLSKTQLYTKIVLIATAVLVFVPTILFTVFDYDSPLLSGYNFWQKLLIGFFNSVTPRTAGYTVVDACALSSPSYLLSVLLMFIGGGSGSTAGGVKVNTLTVLIFGMISVLKNKEDIEIGNKRVHRSLFIKAVAVIFTYIVLILFSVTIISLFETKNPFNCLKYVIYEVVSALCTVGCSASVGGVTFSSTLCSASKIVLTLLMFMGRAGILTVTMALGNQNKVSEVKKPIDNNVLIG